jgi:glycine/D-amino acid oxidase-like deaminating enzyme
VCESRTFKVLYTREGASLHPGRLVRGLAAVVERRGGAIYENTDVTEVRSGRSLLPMYSLISLTAPLKEEQWRPIGWQRYESLASNRFTVDYLTRTADGRILFGSWGAPYAFSFTHQ